MAPGLTDEDLDRISRFVERPRHQRKPWMLCPRTNSSESSPDVERDVHHE